MTDDTRQPTAEELRARTVQLADQLQKAHAEEQERTDAIGRENAELLAAGKPVPDSAQAELDRLHGLIRQLLSAIEQTNLQILEADERERIAAALSTHEKAVQAAALCRDLSIEEQEALRLFAAKFRARREAQQELLFLTRRSGPHITIATDRSWREMMSNEHATHVINVTLAGRLGSMWAYDRLSPFGNDPTLIMDVQTASTRALGFLAITHGLETVPGVAAAAAAAVDARSTDERVAAVDLAENERFNDALVNEGVDEIRAASHRVHGRYAGSKQVGEGN